MFLLFTCFCFSVGSYLFGVTFTMVLAIVRLGLVGFIHSRVGAWRLEMLGRSHRDGRQYGEDNAVSCILSSES